MSKKRLKKQVRYALIAVAGVVVLLLAVVLLQHQPEPEEIQYGSIQPIDVTEEEPELDSGDVASGVPLYYMVLDVGQAQSVFIDYGDTEILIDGGNVSDGEAVAGKIKPYVAGSIEYVIATHSHEDHIGGLSAIYDSFLVSKTIYGDLSDTQTCNIFENDAKKAGEFVEDEDLVITLGTGVTLAIFDVMDGNKNTNNNSVITLLECGQTCFLATGDAEAETEILLKGKLPPCDVVVAGHHGSSTSNTLLEELNPDFFVISCGLDNEYGDPHREVLQMAKDCHCDILATFQSGDIIFTSDGKEVTCNAPAKEYLDVTSAGGLLKNSEVEYF